MVRDKVDPKGSTWSHVSGISLTAKHQIVSIHPRVPCKLSADRISNDEHSPDGTQIQNRFYGARSSFGYRRRTYTRPKIERRTFTRRDPDSKQRFFRARGSFGYRMRQKGVRRNLFCFYRYTRAPEYGFRIENLSMVNDV